MRSRHTSARLVVGPHSDARHHRRGVQHQSAIAQEQEHRSHQHDGRCDDRIRKCCDYGSVHADRRASCSNRPPAIMTGNSAKSLPPCTRGQHGQVSLSCRDILPSRRPHRPKRTIPTAESLTHQYVMRVTHPVHQRTYASGATVAIALRSKRRGTDHALPERGTDTVDAQEAPDESPGSL